MKRKVKLDVVMRSGATVRIHVTNYSVTRNGIGGVTHFEWVSAHRHGRSLITLVPADIDAVVRVSR